MYEVYLDEKLLYKAGDENQVILDSKLELSDNCSGSFEFELPKINLLYNEIKMLSSIITVKKGDRLLFEGRVISIQKNFYGNKKIVCEGALSYFLDSIQEPKKYQNMSIRAFLENVLYVHNSHVEAKKRFSLGMVTVEDSNDSIYRFTNFESTLDVLLEKLVKRLGGHLRIRKVNGRNILDYIKEYDNTNKQVIEFGENLLDYTENLDVSEIATRIIPLGARKEKSNIEGLEEYLDIKEVNNQKNYVESKEAISNFGIITRTVHFDDVTMASNLKKKGEDYLKDIQFADVVLNLKVIDLNMVDKEKEEIKIGDRIRVVSVPHGMDRFFTVTSMSIFLDKPEQNTVILGNKSKLSLSERSISQNQEIIEKIDMLPPQSETLKLAKDNATALLTSHTTGNVVTRSNEILIMDTKDRNTAKKVWRWNINGLGYSKTGINGVYGLAITMNGEIVADYITTGTLKADLIKAGTIKDTKDNIRWNLNTGELIAKKLSIQSTNFTLTPYGSLTAKNVSISGVITTESGDRKTTMRSGYLNIYYGGKELGMIGGNGFRDSDAISGLNFDLEKTGDYMTWAAQPESGGSYNMVWTYARTGFSGFRGGALNAGCDIDMRNYKLHNVSWPDGGINGTMNFVKVNSMDRDGTVSNWTNGCSLQFKNGILISAAF